MPYTRDPNVISILIIQPWQRYFGNFAKSLCTALKQRDIIWSKARGKGLKLIAILLKGPKSSVFRLASKAYIDISSDYFDSLGLKHMSNVDRGKLHVWLFSRKMFVFRYSFFC